MQKIEKAKIRCKVLMSWNSWNAILCINSLHIGQFISKMSLSSFEQCKFFNVVFTLFSVVQDDHFYKMFNFFFLTYEILSSEGAGLRARDP